MSLDGTVDLPAFGATKKRTLLYVGFGVALLAGVYWYRRTNGAELDASSSPAAIDPATGYPYGSPEDLAALDEQAANSAPFDGAGAPVGSLLGDTSQTLAGPVFSDNRAWSQYASDYLVNVSRLHPHDVSEAMGAYITGRLVDLDARNLIDQAIAYAGYPPVAGVGGYPPAIKLKASPAHRSAVNPPQHLRSINVGAHGFTVLWTAAPRAHSYRLRLDDGHPLEVRGTNHYFHDLHADRRYHVHVLALPAADNARPATLTVHTDKAPAHHR